VAANHRSLEAASLRFISSRLPADGQVNLLMAQPSSSPFRAETGSSATHPRHVVSKSDEQVGGASRAACNRWRCNPRSSRAQRGEQQNEVLAWNFTVWFLSPPSGVESLLHVTAAGRDIPSATDRLCAGRACRRLPPGFAAAPTQIVSIRPGLGVLSQGTQIDPCNAVGVVAAELRQPPFIKFEPFIREGDRQEPGHCNSASAFASSFTNAAIKDWSVASRGQPIRA